jgi:integrase
MTRAPVCADMRLQPRELLVAPLVAPISGQREAQIMPLTDTAVRAAKPGPKLKKLSDSHGLQLWCEPSGAKRWRLAYRFAGKQKLLGLGSYPETSLREALELRDSNRKLLALGRDPSQVRRETKAAKAEAANNTFAALVEEVLARKKAEELAEATIGKFTWLMTLVAPALGDRPIGEISAREILLTLRVIERSGNHETAQRLRSAIGQVFRYAIATGVAENDPTTALRGALVSPKVTHYAALIDPVQFGGLLRAIDDYHGQLGTRAAMRLLALTFTRPGELRTAEWSEFDLEKGVWEIPASKMKMRNAHRVPLSRQAIALLRELRPFARGPFLFPSERSASRPMSANTVNQALRRLGFEKDKVCGHGFRSSASSMLNECGLWSPDAIERQLAHVDGNQIRRIYARADFWDERVRMMAWWANYLDELRAGGALKSAGLGIEAAE